MCVGLFQSLTVSVRCDQRHSKNKHVHLYSFEHCSTIKSTQFTLHFLNHDCIIVSYALCSKTLHYDKKVLLTWYNVSFIEPCTSQSTSPISEFFKHQQSISFLHSFVFFFFLQRDSVCSRQALEPFKVKKQTNKLKSISSSKIVSFS